MGDVIYKGRVNVDRMAAALFLVGDFLIMPLLGFSMYIFLDYFRWRLNFFTALVVSGCSFSIIFLSLISINLLVPREFWLTSSEFIVKSWSFVKYGEGFRIPYSEIERAFLYVKWDYRGRERYLVLIKKRGKVNSFDMWVARRNPIFLEAENLFRLVDDINKALGIDARVSPFKGMRVDRVNEYTDVREFKVPAYAVFGFIALLYLLVVLPAVIVPFLVMYFVYGSFTIFTVPLLNIDFTWVMLIIMLGCIAIIFMPLASDLLQVYYLTRDGLYIKKLRAIIFIPRSEIRGLVYLDAKKTDY